MLFFISVIGAVEFLAVEIVDITRIKPVLTFARVTDVAYHDVFDVPFGRGADRLCVALNFTTRPGGFLSQDAFAKEVA